MAITELTLHSDYKPKCSILLLPEALDMQRKKKKKKTFNKRSQCLKKTSILNKNKNVNFLKSLLIIQLKNKSALIQFKF